MPSIGLVISGDSVYNNTHLYLAECDEKALDEWLPALDGIESLHPKAVVAGHGVLDPDSSPRHIEETRRYLLDFKSCLTTTSTPLELYERMLSLHPNRVRQNGFLLRRRWPASSVSWIAWRATQSHTLST